MQIYVIQYIYIKKWYCVGKKLRSPILPQLILIIFSFAQIPMAGTYMWRTRITHNICYSNITYSVTVCTAVHGRRSMCRGVVTDTYITYTSIVYIPNIVYYGCITVPVRLE